MTQQLCPVGCGRPSFWHSFCASCKVKMGYARRRQIEIGASQSARRRAIEALQSQRASIRTVGGGPPR